MDVNKYNVLPYTVERTDNVSVLSDFYCGIDQMDAFIHDKSGLKLYVDSKLTNLWIIRQGEITVGIFALSKSSLILNSFDFKTVKPDAIPNLESLIEQVESFPALKIDYIAIQKDHRKNGIGSGILSLIRDKALEDDFSATLFIIVEAFDTPSYSSVGFYKILLSGKTLIDIKDMARTLN